MNAAMRLAIASYPPVFRERYGVELTALAEQTGASARTLLDLVFGSARAWARPVFTGDPAARTQRRLQASVATTWIAWCAGFLVAPAINRLLLDPPVPSVDVADRRLLDGAQALFVAGWALALIGALALAVPVLRSTPPAGRGRTFRPLLPAFALGGGDGLLLLAVVLVRRAHPAGWTHPSVLFVVLVLAWLAGFLAFVVALGLGPAATLARSRPAGRALRVPGLLALPVALCLAGLTATSSLAAVDAGTGALGAAVVLTGAVASVVALVSGGRGALAVLTDHGWKR